MSLSQKNYPASYDADKKTLVLDLDETLIHCKTVYFENVTATAKFQAGNREMTLFVSKRPNLEEFMSRMAQCYNLVLYTSGLKEYAHTILKLMKIEYYFSAVFHRGHCQKNDENKFEKDLGIIGINPKSVILLDDSTVHIKNQPSNILLIKGFRGEKDDAELLKIADFLEQLLIKSDVRPVMDNFRNYEMAKESEVLTTEPGSPTPKNMQAKFIRDLEESDSESTNEDSSAECDVEDLSENYDGAELSSKMPTLKPQKKAFLDTFIPTMTNIPRSECRNEPSSLIDKLPIMNPKSLKFGMKVSSVAA